MRRGPRNPMSEGLLDERILFLSCGQVGLVHAAAGFFTYFVIMAENGFWPSKLLNLRKFWESRAINDLRDSYDQEWTYEDRKLLEYSCHAGFFFTIVVMQWVTLITSRSSRLSIFQRGMGNWVLNFAILFETLVAFVLIYIPGLNSGLQVCGLIVKSNQVTLFFINIKIPVLFRWKPSAPCGGFRQFHLSSCCSFTTS